MPRSNRRVAITTPEGRVTITGSKTEVFNYFPGWELFWFTFDSPYHGHGLFEILLGDRIDPTRPNITGAVSDWWNNAMWRHKDVAWAIGETILMAFLGTMGAAIIALPLAFMAAKRFAPVMIVRAATRRLFDFVRGVDALIWTVVLARAFGPGPLTGTLAILITDTGTFGKIFSEALENVDQKQIEGVASTGAKPLQRYRSGANPVFPRIEHPLGHHHRGDHRRRDRPDADAGDPDPEGLGGGRLLHRADRADGDGMDWLLGLVARQADRPQGLIWPASSMTHLSFTRGAP